MNPEKLVNRTIVTTYDFADYSLRKENWHYINYVDGTEELYNLENDYEEWDNLAYEKNYKNIVEDFRKKLPNDPVKLPLESLIELQEHHIPPVISRDYYFSEERKKWLERFNND